MLLNFHSTLYVDASEFDALWKYFRVKSQIPETNLITTRATNPRVLILFSIASAHCLGLLVWDLRVFWAKGYKKGINCDVCICVIVTCKTKIPFLL